MVKSGKTNELVAPIELKNYWNGNSSVSDLEGWEVQTECGVFEMKILEVV